MQLINNINPNHKLFFASTKHAFDFAPIVFNFRNISASDKSDKNEKSKNSPREHVPEDENPNKKPQPARDPEDKDKDKVKKEDYTSEGNKRYVKQPTRQADDPYLSEEVDDSLVED